MRYKQSATVEPGGAVSRFTSGTLGRVNPLSLLNLILTGRAYHSSNKGNRPEKHKEIADLMIQSEPDALSDTKVRLEGTNVVDDLIYKKQNEKGDLKWNERLGGRIWHNPRTTVLGKALGSIRTPINAVLANLLRSSHYSSEADAASIYGDEPVITSHELGHAIDFNKPTVHKPRDIKHPDLINRVGRDLYREAYVPGVNLWHEGMANLKSRQALEDALKNDPDKLNAIKARRDEVLPAGYGSYIGNAAESYAGLPLTLPGLVAGKMYGLARGSERRRSYEKEKEQMKNIAAQLGKQAALRKRSNPLQQRIMQGIPQQAPPVQGAPLQASPMQGAPLQAPPIQGSPRQATPMQGPPQQAPRPVTRKQANPLAGLLGGMIGRGAGAAAQARPAPQPQPPAQAPQPGLMQGLGGRVGQAMDQAHGQIGQAVGQANQQIGRVARTGAMGAIPAVAANPGVQQAAGNAANAVGQGINNLGGRIGDGAVAGMNHLRGLFGR